MESLNHLLDSWRGVLEVNDGGEVLVIRYGEVLRLEEP